MGFADDDDDDDDDENSLVKQVFSRQTSKMQMKTIAYVMRNKTWLSFRSPILSSLSKLRLTMNILHRSKKSEQPLSLDIIFY